MDLINELTYVSEANTAITVVLIGTTRGWHFSHFLHQRLSHLTSLDAMIN